MSWCLFRARLTGGILPGFWQSWFDLELIISEILYNSLCTFYDMECRYNLSKSIIWDFILFKKNDFVCVPYKNIHSVGHCLVTRCLLRTPPCAKHCANSLIIHYQVNSQAYKVSSLIPIWQREKLSSEWRKKLKSFIPTSICLDVMHLTCRCHASVRPERLCLSMTAILNRL